jgi:hypothetical protein
MYTNQNNVSRGYWLAWFLGSIMGFGMGAVIAMNVTYGLLPVLVPSMQEFDTTFIVVFGTVFGASGGFLQWVVLRERVPRSGLWVLASALGFAMAGSMLGVIRLEENYLIAGILMMAGYGVVGGILQWLVLKRAQLAQAGLWVVANLIGSLAGAIAVPIANAISSTGNYFASTLAFGLVFGAGLGIVTGAALVWLLRQSPSSNVEGLAVAH